MNKKLTALTLIFGIFSCTGLFADQPTPGQNGDSRAPSSANSSSNNSDQVKRDPSSKQGDSSIGNTSTDGSTHHDSENVDDLVKQPPHWNQRTPH